PQVSRGRSLAAGPLATTVAAGPRTNALNGASPDREGRPFRACPCALRGELELAAAHGELRERAHLDLADALPGHTELAADLREGERVLAAEAVAQLEDGALAPREVVEQPADVLASQLLEHRVVRTVPLLVLDQVAQRRVLLLAGGGLERDRLLRELQQ